MHDHDTLDLHVHTTGNFKSEDTVQLSDIHTCVSKDLRSGFEGHDVVEISWIPHLTHGMCYLITSIYY